MSMIGGGLLGAVMCDVNFGFLVVYRLPYASAMCEIMSRAKLHIHPLSKKEILKIFLLDQLPPCGGLGIELRIENAAGLVKRRFLFLHQYPFADLKFSTWMKAKDAFFQAALFQV